MMITGCVCANAANAAGSNGSGGGAGIAGSNRNYFNNDETVDTIVSSNTRFQAISAISVAQDGVVHVADQGRYTEQQNAFARLVAALSKTISTIFSCPPSALVRFIYIISIQLNVALRPAFDSTLYY